MPIRRWPPRNARLYPACVQADEQHNSGTTCASPSFRFPRCDMDFPDDSSDEVTPKGLKRGGLAIGGWTLSYGFLCPCPSLREEVELLKSAEGDQPLTRLTFEEAGSVTTFDVCVGKLRLQRLAPGLTCPNEDMELQIEEDELESFLSMLQSYLYLNEVRVEEFPPVFLALTKKYDLLPLHFAHLELLVDCSLDYEFRLPAFLNNYDFVLQMMGDQLPRLFWGHLARRFVVEFDTCLVMEGAVPMLTRDYQFRREGGQHYANVWQLLHGLDLLQVMLNFAAGLSSLSFPHVLTFIVTKCVDLNQDQASLTQNRYMQQLMNLNWNALKPVMAYTMDVTREWPENARVILMQSIDRQNLQGVDMDSPQVCFKVEFPRKRKELKLVCDESSSAFKNLSFALKGFVEDDRFFIDIVLWRLPDDTHNSITSGLSKLSLNESQSVAVRVSALECNCLCEMKRFTTEYSRPEHWPLGKESHTYEVLFTERHPKKRILLMKNIEENWFQFHSEGCCLMVNVSLSWLPSHNRSARDLQ